MDEFFDIGVAQTAHPFARVEAGVEPVPWAYRGTLSALDAILQARLIEAAFRFHLIHALA